MLQELITLPLSSHEGQVLHYVAQEKPITAEQGHAQYKRSRRGESVPHPNLDLRSWGYSRDPPCSEAHLEKMSCNGKRLHNNRFRRLGRLDSWFGSCMTYACARMASVTSSM